MEFNTWQDTFSVMRPDLKADGNKMSWEDFYPRATALNMTRPRDAQGVNQLQAEYHWYRQKRPYYRLWPSIIPALTKVNLDRVTCDMLTLPYGLSTLAIYLPKGQEIQYRDIRGNELQAYSFLIASLSMTDPDVVKMPPIERFLYLQEHPELTRRGFMLLVDSHSEGVYDFIKFRQLEGVSVAKEIEDLIGEHRFPESIIKMAVTVMLLDNDPSIISADVLSNDRTTWMNSSDDKTRALIEDRAKRRGKIGWDIGRMIYEKRDVAPHYRNPHFAIRWVRPDRARDNVVKDHNGSHSNAKLVPRLTFIHGSMVKRERALELPSGYEDDL